MITAIPLQDVVRPPGALAVLAACCEQVKIDYHILDLNLYMHKIFSQDIVQRLSTDFVTGKLTQKTQHDFQPVCDHFHQALDRLQPDLIAISIFTYESVAAAVLLLKSLAARSDRSRFSIVIGGLGVSSTKYEITDFKRFDHWAKSAGLIDHVITGEGEISFVEFLKGNFSYPGIDGSPSLQITDVNQLPPPNYNKISPNDYFFSNEPEVVITGSRGCVRSCSFCDVQHWWKKYIYRRGELIADDMFGIWQKTGVRKFDFSDSLINGSIKSFRDMNRRLIELKQKNPDFCPLYKGQFICRPIGQMKFKDYEEMKEAGAETLVVGIEHFSLPIRQHMGKDFDNDAIDWHFATCAKLGIKNVLLLLSGYLTETQDDHAVNLEYLKKYQPYALTRIIYSINIEIGGLAILEGSPLHDWMHDNYPGIDFQNTSNWVLPDNPALDEHERLKRAMEIVYTAADLGYSVLHFNRKIEQATRMFEAIQSKKTAFPIFSLKEILS